MRTGIALLLFLAWDPCQAPAQRDDNASLRYGVALNLRDYPQASAKDTLGSVIRAITKKRIDYLLAHLADPEFTDRRIKEVYSGNFDEFVRETSAKLADNPSTVKELERFLKEGDWQEGEKSASVRLKDIKDREVFLRKVGNRWYLENRQKAEPAKSDQ